MKIPSVIKRALGKVRFSANLKEIDHGLKRIKTVTKSIAQKKAYVKAGLLGKDAERGDGALTNPELGVIHEFGTSSIPARPFINPSFQKNKDAYTKILGKLMKKVLRGDMTYENALELVGLKMASDMKNTITSGPHIPPPLSPETVKRKGSDRPLVDTGRMVGAITHQVVK